MSKEIGGSDFVEWLRTSRASLNIAVCKKSDLPKELVIIDKNTIDSEFQKVFSTEFGKYKLKFTVPVIHRIANIFSNRLARTQSKAVGIPQFALRNAWFSPINSEFSSFVPIRALARHLLVKGANHTFAIHLPLGKMTCLKAWKENELEPIYLAYEMRRKHTKVFLFTEELQGESLNFQLSNAWLRKRFPEYRTNEDGSVVMCRASMRRADYASEVTGAKRRRRPSFFALLRYLAEARFSHRFTVPLDTGPAFGHVRTYAATLPKNSMENGFLKLLLPLTHQVAKWYRTELKVRPTQTVHVADHTSFEGGLLAGEVAKNGGKMCLWPHSANVVHFQVHDRIYVDRITVAAKSTGAHWARKLGNDRVTIDPRTVLPEMPRAPSFDKNHPLTIVLFAGAHSLLRLPLVNYDLHKNTWQEALKTLLAEDVVLKLKHKSIWETQSWIIERAPKGANLEFTNVKAGSLMLPNMIFMSVSFASTALFEGISRGIPAAIIQETPYDETPYYDPSYVPRIHPKALTEYLANLNSKAAWEQLRDRQTSWFERETNSV